jgi:hypothetical protein
MEGRFNRSVYFFLFLCAFVITSIAQTTRGTIAGVITDSSGAVISNASVTATPEAGGEGRTVTTGTQGEYRIEALNPGLYRVEASANGFTKKTVEHVAVRTSQITSNNLALAVGNVSDTVTVEAGVDQIQTETGELSKTIPVQDVRDLPYASLNAYSLAVTLPGVAKVAGRDDFTNGTSFSVNGLRPRSNNFLIDGFDNNDNGIGGQAFQPNNVEAVQEVTVLTNSYQAEFGRGGASVSNISYRSGSNRFHGALWEQYSGSALNAVSPEEAESKLTRPARFVNNIFGFRVGGPAIKDKLFFFGTAQWNRNFGAQQPSTLALPTAAGVATLQSIGPNSNVDILLSQIGNLRGVSNTKLVNIGTRPGCPAPCAVEFGNFTRTDPGANLSREWTVRTDFNPSATDSFYVRYTDSMGSLTPDLFANPAALPIQDTKQGGPSRIFGAMWTHSFSPRVINELRFSGQQINFLFEPTAATLAGPDANRPTMFLASSTDAFFGGFSQGGFPQGRGHKVYQLQDAVSYTTGTHNFKFGADVAIQNINDQIPFNANGSITFASGGDCSAIGLAKCTDLANFIDNVTGVGGVATKTFGNPRISVPTNQQAYYGQDSWKVRPNLTLTYGVRYEYQPPDASNVLPFPSIVAGTFGTEPLLTRHEVKADRNNFGPRVGFAYSPNFWQSVFGNNRTVIRGGYGMFYDVFFTNISDNTAGSSPNAVTFTQFGTTGRGVAGPEAVLAAATSAPSNTGSRTTVVDNLTNPMIHQWNLNVQRELPWKMVAEVAYVGTRGEHLFVSQQLNPRVASGDPFSAGARIVPTFGSTVARTNGGDSVYHGLQTSVSRNVGSVSFRGSYTWSRSIDDMSEVFVSSGGASRWQNVFNPRGDRGPSAFDRTHVAAISYNWALPTFKNSSMFTREVLGGWAVAGIAQWQSGAPETIFLGGWDQNGDGEAFNDRPSMGNPNAKINYADSCLTSSTACSGVGFDDGTGSLIDFNTGAPGTANQFRYIVHDVNSGVNGNVGRNTFRFPGIWSYDMSLFKRFGMPREGHQLELRADAFNLFNHPNQGARNLDGDILSGTFLNLDQTRRGNRTMQLRVKYEF